MNDTEYAYAVSAVRALEPFLIDESVFNQLADCDSYESATILLASKGYAEFEQSTDINTILSNKLSHTYDELKELCPNADDLDFLIIKNDFHNLKASLKALVLSKDAESLFITPSVYRPRDIFEDVKQKNFDALPKILSEVSKKAYEIITSTLDGQLLDIYIDRESLIAARTLGNTLNNKFAKNFCETLIDLSNMNAAVRIAANDSKNENLADIFVHSERYDINELKLRCFKSVDEVLAFIETTQYRVLASAYKASVSAFEREKDNILERLLADAKLISFGIEPVAAYYVAMENEIKMIRIIISCKRIGIEPSQIKERLREVNV